jgi:hypothetical protein
MNNATSLQHVLETYCANSGQMVSLAKSSIFFSPNTHAPVKAEICEVLHIDTVINIWDSQRWLGLIGVTALNTLWKELFNGLMGGRRNNYQSEERKFF